MVIVNHQYNTVDMIECVLIILIYSISFVEPFSLQTKVIFRKYGSKRMSSFHAAADVVETPDADIDVTFTELISQYNSLPAIERRAVAAILGSAVGSYSTGSDQFLN